MIHLGLTNGGKNDTSPALRIILAFRRLINPPQDVKPHWVDDLDQLVSIKLWYDTAGDKSGKVWRYSQDFRNIE